MRGSFAMQEQSSVSAATVLLSQCSLQDRGDMMQKNSYGIVRQFSVESNGSGTSHIQRRNAVGNLFEGIDLAVIKQLSEIGSQKMQ